jgi:hypothetical protein
MQLFEFSLQRLAGLQAESVATGLAIKRYHWSSLLRIGVFALLSNTQTALATMSTPLTPRIVVFFLPSFAAARCGVAPEVWFAAFVQQRDSIGPTHNGRS